MKYTHIHSMFHVEVSSSHAGIKLVSHLVQARDVRQKFCFVLLKEQEITQIDVQYTARIFVQINKCESYDQYV
jgi:hypothetical protein